MKKKRHLTPQEIIARCNAVARESRMADRTPWTAMAILCAYSIMRKENFKGQRIAKITGKVNELEEQWSAGEISMESVSKRLYEKADWTIEYKPYTTDDIRHKKGTFDYWFDSVQIGPQNTINEQAARYMLFFFNVLMSEYGFGKERLTRVQEYMNELLESYQRDKNEVRDWRKALYEEAGVVMEMPIDPLTQTAGSLMTG